MNYIICINNINVENYLTVNKQYELIDLNKYLEEYTIICDQNFEGYFHCSRFITLKEYEFIHRKDKIEKILND